MAINTQAIIEACDKLSRRIITVGGEYHGSPVLFDRCMRAFTAKLPAEAITFAVFYNAPVMKAGEATIHRDGSMECRVVDQEGQDA